MTFLLSILILISTTLVASTNRTDTVISVCAKDSKRLKQVLKNANFIKVSDDRFNNRNNCLDISTTSHREVLFRKYLSSTDPTLKILNTATTVSSRVCRLKFIKKTMTVASDFIISNDLNHLELSSSKIESQNKEVSFLTLIENIPSPLVFYDKNMSLTCHIRNGDYQIEIKSSSKNFNISTSVFIKKNAMMTKIGSFFKTNNNKNKDIHIIENTLNSSSSKKLIELYLKGN